MTARDWVLVTAALAVLSLVPVVWAIVDVTRRPAWQFPAGRKALWAVALGLGWLMVWPFALVLSVVYLAVMRRRFPSVQGAIGPQSLPYAGYPPQPPPQEPPLPPSGWYPDPAGSGAERWWDGRGWTENLR